MLDPFSLLPIAIVAHGGRVDGYEAQQLVAAGLTLLQRSAPLVRALSGKRAAILLPTSPAFFTALAAAEGRGAVLINPLAAPPEISHQLADARVGAVFTTTELAPRIAPDVPLVLLDDAPRAARVAIDGASRDVDLGSHTGLNLEGDVDALGRDEEAAIVYTSAMAGVPLGAILTHRNLLANARSTVLATASSSDDRVLALLPLSHLFGLTVTAAAPLLAGGTIVTMSKFSASRAADLLESESITEVVGVPSVFRALLAAIERRGRGPTAALRLCICGGAPLDVTLQDRWFDATGVELRHGYGLTEAGPVCVFNRADKPNARGTIGFPFPGTQVELRPAVVYDRRGAPMPNAVSTQQELCVRGDSVFRGYVSRGEDGLPVHDGWLHTGDLARRQPTGHLVFSGVAKPMFTRNGFNIYPREIERVVAEMPGVLSASVRGEPVPDREWDIVLEIHGDVSKEAVEQWCAERLSAYKQPTAITIR